MRSTCTLLTALTLCGCIATAQNTGRRTDVYHVHFTQAVPGKAVPLANYLKTPDPKAPMPGHFLVLRHRSGDEWDYVRIEHLGAKAVVDAATPPPDPSVRDLSAWHGDTFVNGPAWAEFSRAMGIDGQSAAGRAGSVYVVSVYRAVPGHRDQLQKMVAEPLGPGDKTAGIVVLQHLEGAPWNYLGISRYNSWSDFGASENSSSAALMKSSGGWFQLRDHVTFHRDTLADRIAP
jgi:hypothetical protein